jgi:hypothetical protein
MVTSTKGNITCDVPSNPPVSPEPATMALMALGTAGLLLRRKRK